MNIYSMDGRQMHTEKIIANGYPELKTLDLSNKIYADGMYLLRFFSEDENKMIKIVKHR